MCDQCKVAPTEANIHRLIEERDAARANHLKTMQERDEAIMALNEVKAARAPVLGEGTDARPDYDAIEAVYVQDESDESFRHALDAAFAQGQRAAPGAGDAGLREALAAIRGDGWVVAVHNDYRIAGQSHTFWLFTHPSGRWVKGEGETDEIALAEIRRALAAPPGPAPSPDAEGAPSPLPTDDHKETHDG